jgi:hypothetical protein
MIGESPHGFDSYRTGREGVHTGHAHQSRFAVDFGGTRTAFTGFAIPATGQVGCLRGLDLMHHIQHDHAFADLGLIFPELSTAFVTTPDTKNCRSHVNNSLSDR